MVEINNQRKAFLDMLAWSEELITDVRKPEIAKLPTVIVGRELFTDYSITLANLSPNQNSNQRAPDATSFFPVGGMPAASSLAERLLSKKVRTLWHCSRLRAAALPD